MIREDPLQFTVFLHSFAPQLEKHPVSKILEPLQLILVEQENQERGFIGVLTLFG